MEDNKKILWLITARSGSKGVPNKNIKKIAGIPLIEYKIKSALNSKYPDFVWLSTDSKNYAKIGENAGAFIPFIRPSELATDSSSSIDVVLHAMKYAEELNLSFDFIGLLEPTSPFVSEKSLEMALEILISEKNADGIVSVKEVLPHPIWLQDDDRYLKDLSVNIELVKNQNRQNFPTQITPSGGFYIARWNSFLKHKTFYCKKTLSYKLFGEESIEIDTIEDFDYISFLINSKKNNK